MAVFVSAELQNYRQVSVTGVHTHTEGPKKRLKYVYFFLNLRNKGRVSDKYGGGVFLLRQREEMSSSGMHLLQLDSSLTALTRSTDGQSSVDRRQKGTSPAVRTVNAERNKSVADSRIS